MIGARVPILLRRPFSPVPEAAAVFAAMTTPPTLTRKVLLNTCIVAIKAAGAWALLDILYLTAAADAQAAGINLIAPGTFTLTAVNSPAFLADRGYTGDASTSYLTTGFIPTSGSPRFTQNGASMGVHIGTAVTSNSKFDIGNSTSEINARGSTSLNIRANDGSTDAGVTVGTSVGGSAWVRRASTGFDSYKNGVNGGTVSRNSTAIAGVGFFLAASNNAGSPANPSNRQLSAAYAGGALSDAQMLGLHNAIAAYLTAIGAPT